MKKDNKYQKILRYIERYWERATFSVPRDQLAYLGLPNKFVSPNAERFKKDQFYWDSYFIILGLIESGRVKLARGMVDNFIFLFRRLGVIPASNRFFNAVISQPPFLTSMILEVFRAQGDKKWLKGAAQAAEDELDGYWLFNGDDHWLHVFPDGLSRYAGCYRSHMLGEYESGWDTTSRFHKHALHLAAVDLNSLLYKYEADLAEIFGILGNQKRQKMYLKRAAARQKLINKKMWSGRRGFYFDYHEKKKRRSRFWSLAGFYPLWAGLATAEQAEQAVKNLKRFEYRWGLANTQRRWLFKPFRQWDYPNGWANQEWIVIKGLLNYGYEEEARRLAGKWLDLNIRVFEETGKLWEKYDVVRGAIGLDDRYPIQSGFGWTNAVFLKLVRELGLE